MFSILVLSFSSMLMMTGISEKYSDGPCLFTSLKFNTGKDGYNQVEYDFDYYAEDSMKVSVYIPNHTSKTNYICHMKDGKITQIV